jgi:hypothetical protein
MTLLIELISLPKCPTLYIIRSGICLCTRYKQHIRTLQHNHRNLTLSIDTVNLMVNDLC